MTENNALRLQGFNNLSKTLSISFYDVCYVSSEKSYKKYQVYCQEKYSAKNLARILSSVVDIIDAKILSATQYDYEPHGASAMVLLAEETSIENSCLTNSSSSVAHLDKSHLTIHSYPDTHPQNSVYTLRVDVEISTCGRISPLQALNYLIDQFCAEVLTFDYKVRGMTRKLNGDVCFLDSEIQPMQTLIDHKKQLEYQIKESLFLEQRWQQVSMRVNDILHCKSNIYNIFDENFKCKSHEENDHLEHEISILYQHG